MSRSKDNDPWKRLEVGTDIPEAPAVLGSQEEQPIRRTTSCHRKYCEVLPRTPFWKQRQHQVPAAQIGEGLGLRCARQRVQAVIIRHGAR